MPTKKAVKPPPVTAPTPDPMTVERGIKLLRDQAASVNERYIQAKQKFIEAVEYNPKDAIESCDWVVRRQSEHETWRAAAAVMQDMDTAAEQFNVLVRYVDKELRRFVDVEPWKANCTSPTTNLVNLLGASGRASALGNIRDTAEYIMGEIAKEPT